MKRCTNLRSLRFQFFQFQDTDLLNFRYLTVLRSLWFFNGSLTDEQCHILSPVLSQSITELKLSGPLVHVAGILCFAQSHSNIEHLSIVTTAVHETDNPAAHIFGREKSKKDNFLRLKTICVRQSEELFFNEVLHHVGRHDVVVNSDESPFAPMRGFRESWGP